MATEMPKFYYALTSDVILEYALKVVYSFLRQGFGMSHLFSQEQIKKKLHVCENLKNDSWIWSIS